MLRIRVRFFALYREVVGLKETTADLPDGSTPLDLWEGFTREYPRLASNRQQTRFAVNGEYVDAGTPLHDADEVVFIPPVGGGADYEITPDPIDVNAVAESVRHDEDGGVVTFIGVVRNQNRGKQVVHLEYEAYDEMALGEMRKIGDEIRARWGLDHLRIVHRVGRTEIGEASVMIAVAAPHRDVAFEACRFAIDRLKETVPVWKKEIYTDGEVWLANRN